jgi:benzoyl-CoA reductase/2-hydroxyglutaryl-CoA dehydratase subunit BcrC/BadD/HgdB
MGAFATFQKYYKERWNYALLAKDWKEKEGKVIGYPHINCPEEIIMAAHCLPLMMTGDPDSGTETADKHMEYYFSPNIRYLYQAILTGRYYFVDLICITTGDIPMNWTYHYLEREKSLDSSKKFGELYFLDQLKSKYSMDRSYNLDRLKAFKEYLEEYTGKIITDESLSEAIKITNQTKRLLKQVSDLRKSDPPHISGCEALPIIMASMLIPKLEYNKLLEQFLKKEINDLPKKDASKFRLFVSGSAVDNLQLYEILESLPAIVVGEDTAFGDRYSDAPISEEHEPMEALADRYTYKPADPWADCTDDNVKYRVESAVKAKAQGVIFHQLQWDEPLEWEYPDQKRELEKHNIPILRLASQEYKVSDTAREQIRSTVKAFVEAKRSY